MPPGSAGWLFMAFRVIQNQGTQVEEGVFRHGFPHVFGCFVGLYKETMLPKTAGKTAEVLLRSTPSSRCLEKTEGGKAHESEKIWCCQFFDRHSAWYVTPW